MNIRDLNIESKVANTLDSLGIGTIEDLQKHMKNGKLSHLTGIGKVAETQIKGALVEAGKALPMPQSKERPPVPDDDQLADMVIGTVRSEYRYFHSAWNKWQNGLWEVVKNINSYIMKVLRENRKSGVRLTKGRVNSVDFFVQTALEIADDTVVDDYPQYFNVQNGLFNLDTMELEKHRKDVFVTAQAGFAYDESANAPMFKKWLTEMLVKPNTTETDYSLINLVQELMGYCLTADTSHRVSFWIVGGTGTGKSTLVTLMVNMMKSYHKTIDLNQLATNRFLLATIAGKRLVTSMESSAGVKLDDGVYKTLVSDDVLLADVKNRDPIEFVPQCKIVWAMNNLPYIGDRSGAMGNRITIIPMTREIPRNQWDRQLDEKLNTEMPGIFNFALQGLHRLRSQGYFTRVEQSEDMSDRYRKMQDIYAAFLEDEMWCELGNYRTTSALLYKAFSEWCTENGIRNYASKLSAAREWERLGLKRVNTGGRSWKGVRLKTQGSTQYL